MVTLDAHPVSGPLLSRQHHLEIAVGIGVQLVDQRVRCRRNAIHGLQAHVAGGAAVPGHPVTFAATQHRPGIDAVRALHAPGQYVIGAGSLYPQHRIRVEPQHFVDPGGEQNQQMPHAGGEISPIPVRGIGLHLVGGGAEPVQQIRPRLPQAPGVTVF
jgi:hypothetical protein